MVDVAETMGDLRTAIASANRALAQGRVGAYVAGSGVLSTAPVIRPEANLSILLLGEGAEPDRAYSHPRITYPNASHNPT